ncbi:Crp/Fnr family transcriptional regulator (plasmid) [Rhizobium sp. CCGE531]|nr:Crp/Fnr family transcriptional regulator [Rhizobium sp. CCGE531]AYG76289.1 Crp/Fnr family transcriptional regulator [Rhizobium sp. CCGE532]
MLFDRGDDGMAGQISIGNIQSMGGMARTFAAGSMICDYETNAPRLLFLLDGWAASSKMLPNGTRFVTEFVLRGDMISTSLTAHSRETVQAITNVSVMAFPDFTSIPKIDAPALFYRIAIAELVRRQARMSESLANIGRRDALERTGYLLLELGTRIGTSQDYPNSECFDCPLTQADIGDAVGLSTVHINRVLRDMREAGLLSFRNGIVAFLDRPRLMDLVDFDESYFDTTMV